MLDRATETATTIAFALRNQLAVTDDRFDRLFPNSHRLRSHFHWTPVEVALRVAELLAASSCRRVLDVGSGVGKLCLIGAASTAASWVGIEANATMVRVADDAARLLCIDRNVEFICGDATVHDWAAFDAIYMFNPFAEHLIDLSRTPEQRRDRFVGAVERARFQLARVRIGTYVVTYHGFGGVLDDDFELVHHEPARHDRLCMWIRRAR